MDNNIASNPSNLDGNDTVLLEEIYSTIKMDDLCIVMEFISALQKASLHVKDVGHDRHTIQHLHNPSTESLSLNGQERLCVAIKLYLGLPNANQNYKTTCTTFMELSNLTSFPTLFQVTNVIVTFTGGEAVVHDMYTNSCIYWPIRLQITCHASTLTQSSRYPHSTLARKSWLWSWWSQIHMGLGKTFQFMHLKGSWEMDHCYHSWYSWHLWLTTGNFNQVILSLLNTGETFVNFLGLSILSPSISFIERSSRRLTIFSSSPQGNSNSFIISVGLTRFILSIRAFTHLCTMATKSR